MFGNVNVDYKPCKTVKQLERVCNYILGRNPEQIRQGVVKTADNLYFAFDGNRDRFADDILLTRRLFGKPCNGRNNLAYKMSISFHPDDNKHLTYEEAFQIAKEFAERYFHSKGFDVMFAVHTDTEHIHAHFIIGNCNRDTGRAFRRNQRDLYEMSEFFGQQCTEHGLTHSVRETFYSENPYQQKEKYGEIQIEKKGKETFKAELREVIDIECADPNNTTLEDVVNSLWKHYNVECRLKGNTISYRHPQYKNKNGQLVSVRGSKLGEKYTVRGIAYELEQKRNRAETDRTGVLFTGEVKAGCCEKALTAKATAAGSTGITIGQIFPPNGGANGGTGTSGKGRGISSEEEQGTAYAAYDNGKIRTDTGGLFEEYRRRVERTKQESDKAAERAGRVRKKRSGQHR